ncbi:T9SS C-terminal target domain-containing protein [Chryseobacterium carnipullorum]|uniref:T9SS C-terminal target domain-containing protein n=2 Tax=Chryseobacterium carnipullorum TaxID=1124835 RepID=A0A3G6NCP4_CHRCU|nr:T9SS type A sorting domain-containing protein [Chryseobacterium carnipullorum]AZA50880.1 T9SS C-terminal target domain-containing protein [Chryseobacterium carnipullorum]AZA65742.1 T9SS C-terminal target domain-containing protein [Chryseobacterium carnipullorum]
MIPIIGPETSKVQIIDEDKTIIKDFSGIYHSSDMEVYHNPTHNLNEIKLLNRTTNITYIYSLPTSPLATEEIATLKNKLIAFPNPAKTVLKIANPKNSTDKVDVFDTTGKLILSKTFTNQDDTFSLNVETLAKGLYLYKIGERDS